MAGLPMAEACPEPDDLMAFAEGKLPAAKRGDVESHLDSCASCEELAAELARAFADSNRSTATQPSSLAAGRFDVSLEPGTRLSRYHVLERVGAGAMGVVYAAYDPDLDRRIALKILRRRGEEETSAIVLLREAQAMARLSHPNVITVHEAGEADGRVFLAMEFVDGNNLREWLEESDHPWREILDVFIQVGRGLCAAHDAGLVHRDVKPDNVLLREDGRALVTDFGLARTAAIDSDEGRSTRPQPSRDALGARLTRQGALVGTPAYMAPELIKGHQADAASDQFGFCVALYEALYGTRPFLGSTLAKLAVNIEEAKTPDPPRDRGVPRWLEQVALRGLARLPGDRFGSLRELLKALERGGKSGARRRQVALLAGALVIGGGVAYGASELGDAPCREADEKLVGVWDADRRAEVEQIVLGIKAPYAADTWKRARVQLDQYAQAWTAQHVDACLATAVRHEQSPQLLDSRMRCLGKRRNALRGTVDALVLADRETLASIGRSIERLPSLAPCEDADALLAAVAPPEDPATRVQVEALRAEMSDATALTAAGHYEEAAATLLKVREKASGIDYRPFEAEILYELGARQVDAGDLEAGVTSLEEAVWLGRASGADAVVRDASIRLIAAASNRAGSPEPGLDWAKRAWAEVERTGKGGIDEASLRVAESIALRKATRYDEAKETLRIALDLLEAEFGPDHPHIAVALGQLGPIEQGLSNFEAGEAALRRSVEIYETALGPHHPDVGHALSNLARIQFSTSSYEESLKTRRRALEIFEASLPPNHPHLSTSYGSLGNVLGALGRYKEAAPHLERAVEISIALGGPDHPGVAIDLYNLSIVELSLGRQDDALAHAKRALDILAAKEGDPHPNYGSIMAGYADALGQVGRLEESVEWSRRVVELQREIHGEDRPAVGIALVNLGAAYGHLERWDEARPPLEEGIEILEASLGPKHDYVIMGYETLGSVIDEQGEFIESLEIHRRVLALRIELFGPDHPDVATSHHNIGASFERRGNHAKALVEYEKALEIFANNDPTPPSAVEADIAVGRLLWETGGDKVRAIELTQRARDTFAARPGGGPRLPDLDEWLAKHKL